jgi:hypothetical protein
MTGGSEIVMTGPVDSCGTVTGVPRVVPAEHADNACRPSETSKTLPHKRVSCDLIASSFDAHGNPSASI